MLNLIHVLSIVFQALIVKKAINIISIRKQTNVVVEIFCWLTYVGFSIAKFFIIKNQYISLLASIVLIYMISYAYTANQIKRIALPLIMSIMFFSVELLFGFIISLLTTMPMDAVVGNRYYYMLGLLGSKLLVFFIVLICNQIVSKSDLRRSAFLSIILLILPLSICIILFVVMEMMYSNTSSILNIMMTIGVLVFISVIVLMMLVIERDIAEKSKNARLEMYNQEMQHQVAKVGDLVEEYKYSNKQLHDIKNQLIVLKGMHGSNKQYDVEYYAIAKTVDKAASIVYTGIVGLDAILNDKISKMHRNNIKCKNEIIMASVKIDEMKFSVLVANILDNSIEESQKLLDDGKAAEVDIHIMGNANEIHLCIANNCSENALSAGTSKANKHKHGYGKLIINNIVEELSGQIYSEKSLDNRYLVKIFIPLNP